MLILTRRVGESIVINDNITVTLLSVTHNQIRLGIEAPKDIPVHRKEIHLKIQKEKENLNGNNSENFGNTRPE